MADTDDNPNVDRESLISFKSNQVMLNHTFQGVINKLLEGMSNHEDRFDGYKDKLKEHDRQFIEIYHALQDISDRLRSLEEEEEDDDRKERQQHDEV